MSRCLWLVLLICACVHRSYGIEAVASRTVFYVPQGQSYAPYAEVYWQIAPGSLSYKEDALKQFIAKVRTELIFFTDTGIIRADRFIMQTNPAASLGQTGKQNIIELHRYMLPPGKIKMQLTLTDLANDNKPLVITDSFKVDPIGEDAKYSGIQILDTTYASAENNIFSKNNMQQIPLCANFLDQSRRTLTFYTELYQTEDIPKEELPLIQTAFISRKPLTAPVYGIKRTDTIQQAGIRPFIGKFNIAAAPSGNYYLNLILENKDHERIAASSVFFQRLNVIKDTVTRQTADADTTFEKVNFLDLSTTFMGKYTLPQLKAILKMIRPISNAIEGDAIDNFTDKPDENYMRYFIYNFWKQRNDKEPKKEWDKYAELVKAVNKMFKGELMQGYETDRGQVYLKYGKPNDMITVNNESGALPYEIWVYNVLANQSLGGMFLFYRPADYISGFKLLHSNVRGEVRTPAWRAYLYLASGSSSGNTNSRAEQYFSGNK